MDEAIMRFKLTLCIADASLESKKEVWLAAWVAQG